MTNSLIDTSPRVSDARSGRPFRSLSRRRPGIPSTAAVREASARRNDTHPTAAPAGRGGQSQPRQLRRWSVAELIARADGLPRAAA